MPWKSYEYKGDIVFVRMMADGRPKLGRGMVEFRYKKGASKSYRTKLENLDEPYESEVFPDEDFASPASKQKATVKEKPSQPAGPDTIEIFTDGACSGNPGPAGLGVYLMRPSSIVEISEFMGNATNNAAELSAILRALEEIKDDETTLPIHLYTDSAWSLGVLIGGWKAKTNIPLIDAIKTQIERFSQLELLKIKGHAGHEGNEEADYLATRAVRREDSSRKERPRRT